MKHTDNDHPDYENLQKALEQVKEVADFINESKRNQENKEKIKDIQVINLTKNQSKQK